MVQTWFPRWQQLNWRCGVFIPRNLYEVFRLTEIFQHIETPFLLFQLIFSLARLVQWHPGTNLELCIMPLRQHRVFQVTFKGDTVITQNNSLIKCVSRPRKQRHLNATDASKHLLQSFYTTTQSRVEHSEILQGPGKALRCFWVSSVWQHCWRTEDTTQRLQEQGWY